MPLQMFNPKEPVLIAVASGKGGVGKSTVAVNLALALKKKGLQIGLMDTDLYGPSVRRMLPEDRMPSQEDKTIIPALCRGIKMISMAYFRKEHEPAVMRAPIANNLIKQFLNDVEWGPLDYIVIDYPPGTGDIQLTLSQQAPVAGAVLVTTPQEVAVMDVRRAAHLFHQVQVPILGIVENMSYYLNPTTHEKVYLFGNGGGERLAEELGVPLLARIPVDPMVSARLDRGESIFDAPAAPSAEIFTQLAENVHTHLATGKIVSPIQKVYLDGPAALCIEWTDGAKTTYQLFDLQSSCPCAACHEAKPIVSKDVTTTSVLQVGRYALKIQFTSGCSNGIYRFEHLRELAEVTS